MALGVQSRGADLIRLVVGAGLGGLATFVTGFVLWGTPLAAIAYSRMEEPQSAAVQAALAANVPHTGRYLVPDPSTPGGTELFGRGPVATVDFNTGGFATADPGPLIGGLIQSIVAVLLIGLALLPIADRVIDWRSRARVAVGVSAAAAVLLELAEPIYFHGDWRFALYALVADILMLAAGALVLVRWFLPEPSAVRQP